VAIVEKGYSIHFSIQSLAIARNSDSQGDHRKKCDGPNFGCDLVKAISFEEYSACYPQEMGQRQNLADPLSPDRHAPERKQVARKQDGGEKNKKGHLHSLKLVLRNGGKHDPHGEIGRNKDKSGDQQEWHTPKDGHAKHKIGHEKDQAQLQIADDNIGGDLSHQDFQRARWHGEEIFHRAPFALAGNGQPSDHNHSHGEDDAHESRHDVILSIDFGIVERVNLQIEGAVRAIEIVEWTLEVIMQSAREKRIYRAEGVACRTGVRRIGLDQNCRPIATENVTGKIGRYADNELRVTARESLAAICLAFQKPDCFVETFLNVVGVDESKTG
jgi:hypothetical protein